MDFSWVPPVLTSAIPMLAAFLAKAGDGAAGRVGEAAADYGAAIAHTIRTKLQSDNDQVAKQALLNFEQNPLDSRRQAVLIGILAEKLDSDPQFAGALEAIVSQISHQPSAVGILVQFYGDAKVEKIINFTYVQEVHIN
jgi:hypothetical protein